MSVTAYYRKDSKRWYISIHDTEWLAVFGKRRREPVPGAKGKKDAIRLGEERRALLLAEFQSRPKPSERQYLPDGRAIPLPEDTFGYFVENFYLPFAETNKAASTVKSERWRCRQLIDYFGSYRLMDISYALCLSFQAERKARDNQYGSKESNASVNRICEILQRIFGVAIDLGILNANPASKLASLRELPRNRILSLSEEQALAGTLEPSSRRMLRLSIVLALNAGLRKGEILRLTKADIDLERNLLHVRNGKTGNRHVPLNSVARLAILSTVRLAEMPETGLVFGGVDWIKDTFPVVCKEAGIEDLHFHDLRATYTTRMLENGFDAFTAMDATGHSNIKTTAIYARITSQRLRDAVESLSDKVSPIHRTIIQGNFGHNLVTDKEKGRDSDPLTLAS